MTEYHDRITIEWTARARTTFSERQVHELAASDEQGPQAEACREWVEANPALLDLDSLPVGTEVRDKDGDVNVKLHNGRWMGDSADVYDSRTLAPEFAPYTVVYRPPERTTRDLLHELGYDDERIAHIGSVEYEYENPSPLVRACRKAEQEAGR